MLQPKLNRIATKQQGAVLIVSLIILLLLTIIGLSSSNRSNMQSLMTANTQFKAQALIAVEKTLKAGEQQIDNITTDGTIQDFSTTTDHYYTDEQVTSILTDAGIGSLADLDWDVSTLNTLTGTDSYSDNKYIIEYFGKDAIPGESAKIGTSATDIKGGYVYTFRVTARSTTQKGAARVAQSIYVTSDEP